MAKVTVVGAGNVGATCANVLAHKDIVKEVVLLDIKGDVLPKRSRKQSFPWSADPIALNIALTAVVACALVILDSSATLLIKSPLFIIQWFMKK